MTFNSLELNFHGTTITIETGQVARLADGAVVVKAGGTVVLVTACGGSIREADFFPLSVDYIEKSYAAGKIPGGFFKREGKLSERETLVSRLIDRPCRPLFPDGYSREVQVVATVLSADNVNSPDTLALLGASAALTLSALPFEGPVAGVRVGRIDGKLVINPSMEDMEKSDLDFMVAGSRDAIVMVEGEADEFSEAEVLDLLFFAHKELQKLIDLQLELQKLAGKAKEQVVSTDNDQLRSTVFEVIGKKVEEVVRVRAKADRVDAIKQLSSQIVNEIQSKGSIDGISDDFRDVLVRRYYDEALSNAVRRMVFEEGVRIDGRDTKTVRPISIQLGLLPRTHGSALFTRGETQALVIVTLGTEQEAQRLDSLEGESSKKFMLHYNFPPFSVGECRPLRGPGRREVGHGALAERAVKQILPTKDFPYVIRIVSEITESNGSSSMASVCGSSLALMQAGVPVKSAVAGVAMGLLVEDGEKFSILTDILGDEDHLGDMDFKVCGTEKGITAVQMDIKVKGLSRQIMEAALNQAKLGRLHILNEMKSVIDQPAKSLSEFAPKVVTIKINPDKIRDIIGPGGKMIRSITESCGVKIEVTDDGTVNIASSNQKSVDAAIAVIEGLTQEVTIGKLYEGVVKRVVDFGAFVEVIPGTDGLVHISHLSDARVKQVTDVVQEGDIVWVKVLDIDRQGKIRLSMKDAAVEMSSKTS